MQLLRWNNPGQDTRRASSMVRGAGCREINPRLRRREKNVLDIPFYRSGVLTTLRFCFAFLEVKTRDRDITTVNEKGDLFRPPFLSALNALLPTKIPYYAAFGAFFAASFSFSALIAGANCSITESRLNEAAFWRGG